MHPKLKYALEAGYVEPALMTDGSQLVIEDVKYYVFANNGEKLTQSRLYAFSDFLEEFNRFVAKKEDIQTGMDFIEEILTEALMVVSTEPKECINLITQAKFRAQSLKQRVNLGASVERIWEISAIWFLAEDEDPEINDPVRNKKKVLDFQTRLELIGFFQRWVKNVWNALPRYLDMSLLNAIREINMSEILQNQIFILSTNGEFSRISKELKDSLSSQMEIWTNVNDSLDYLHTSSIN
jgi:hypothetical protein